jgi:hypothetical protein
VLFEQAVVEEAAQKIFDDVSTDLPIKILFDMTFENVFDRGIFRAVFEQWL